MNVNLRKIQLATQILIVFGILASLVCCQPGNYRSADLATQTISVTKGLVPDSLMEAYIAPYRDTLEAQMNRVIGTAEKELLAGFPESPLSNFVADLLLIEAHKRKGEMPQWQEPDIAIVNVKGLRAPIAQGNITVRDIFQLMPFENELVIIELSGQEVTQLFDYMASVDGDGIAGAKFGIWDGKAQHITIQQQQLKNDQTYYVATSDYLANGGDHFEVFKNAKIKTGTGLKLRDLIIEHIEALQANGKVINSSLDNRIYHVTK